MLHLISQTRPLHTRSLPHPPPGMVSGRKVAASAGARDTAQEVLRDYQTAASLQAELKLPRDTGVSAAASGIIREHHGIIGHRFRTERHGHARGRGYIGRLYCGGQVQRRTSLLDAL